MKPHFLAVPALLASWVIVLSPPAAFTDPPSKEAELLKRIEQLEKRVVELEKQLEKRVAELEKAIKDRCPSDKEPATDTEKNLVGNWTITDADRKGGRRQEDLAVDRPGI
jgi:hypothetical protein